MAKKNGNSGLEKKGGVQGIRIQGGNKKKSIKTKKKSIKVDFVGVGFYPTRL